MKAPLVALALAATAANAQIPAEGDAYLPGRNAEFLTFAASATGKVAGEMKDPDAAKFRHLFVSLRGIDGGRGGYSLILCGEVNGKNSYGAYNGFRPFFFSDDKGLFIAGDGEADRMIVGAAYNGIGSVWSGSGTTIFGGVNPAYAALQAVDGSCALRLFEVP